MAELIDHDKLDHAGDFIEVYEDGEIWIVKRKDDEPNVEIKLDADAALKMMDFLFLHQDRLNRHARVDRGE